MNILPCKFTPNKASAATGPATSVENVGAVNRTVSRQYFVLLNMHTKGKVNYGVQTEYELFFGMTRGKM